MELAGRRSLRAASLAVAALVLLAILVPSAGAATAKPKSGGAVTWLISAEPTTMDPIVAGTLTTPAVFSVYDRLIYIDPISGRLTPGLATAVTPSDNATVWTIKLRANLTFTDGTPVNADAVRFNWDRIKNTQTASDRTTSEGFSSYTVVDPLTIKVTLPAAIGSFPQLLQRSLGFIASPTAIQKFGGQYGTSPSTTVGAGAFKVSEWVRGDHMTLVRNDGYWDKPKPYLDSLTLKPVADPTQKANAMQAGQADMAWLPVLSAADQQLINGGFKFVRKLQDGGISVIYNMSKAPFDDVRVRKALTLALDLNDLNQKAAGGLAQVVDTYAAKTSPFYHADVKQQTEKLAEAQKLIDSYVKDKGGQPVSFTLLSTTSLQTWTDATMQQWAKLKNVNITPDIQTPTGGQSKGFAGLFEAWYASTPTGRSPDYPESYYALYHSGQTTNLQKVSIPALDKVLDATRDAVTVQQRSDALQKITKVLVDDSVQSLVYRLEQRTYYSSKVKGLKMSDPAFPGTASIWLSSK